MYNLSNAQMIIITMQNYGLEYSLCWCPLHAGNRERGGSNFLCEIGHIEL